MTRLAIPVLLWFGAIGCGILAGVYFAFSCFVMNALGRLPAAHGIAAMNSINTTILGSVFMPFFWGTTVASLILVPIGFVHRGAPGAAAMTMGGLIYVAGMFACTAFFNVPLNNRLAAADPANPTAAPVWAHFLRAWTLWNHLRTVSSIAATALYISALVAVS